MYYLSLLLVSIVVILRLKLSNKIMRIGIKDKYEKTRYNIIYNNKYLTINILLLLSQI